MAYDILSDDVFDPNDKQPRRRRKNRNNNDTFLSKIQPFYVHLIVILLLIIGLLFFFISDISFDFDEFESGQLTLLGDLSNFSKNYVGDLNLYSAKFSIESNSGKFDGESQNLKIENFTGEIYQSNNSMYIKGNASTINYGNNVINLKGDEFKMISKGKTQIDLNFDTVKFLFVEGKAKLDSSLSYDFDNSYIYLTNFNSTMTYDGTFSFSGTPETFNITSPKQHILILYTNE